MKAEQIKPEVRSESTYIVVSAGRLLNVCDEMFAPPSDTRLDSVLGTIKMK